MLQHEHQEQSTATPTAQIRVTAEELAQAINALEASKDEEAQHLAGTVAIGQVVDELKLEATPEELWAQVQKQRTRLAAEVAAAQSAAEAKEARKQAARLAAYQVPPRPRQRRRGRWWMILGIGWIAYGIAHGHLSHLQAALPPRVIVGGSHLRSQTYNVSGKDVIISGNDDTLYLHGSPLSVTVNGDNDRVVTDTARNVKVNGNNDTLNWVGAPTGEITDNGHDNQIAPQRQCP